MDKLTSILRMIVDQANYKQILTSLFTKFKQSQNLTAISTILEIEEEFIFQNVSEDVYSQFQKFFILYILVPLLDLYGNNAKLNEKHSEVVERLLARVHSISEQDDEQSAVVIDWCLKWVNMELNSEQTQINNFTIYTFYLKILRS